MSVLSLLLRIHITQAMLPMQAEALRRLMLLLQDIQIIGDSIVPQQQHLQEMKISL